MAICSGIVFSGPRGGGGLFLAPSVRLANATSWSDCLLPGSCGPHKGAARPRALPRATKARRWRHLESWTQGTGLEPEPLGGRSPFFRAYLPRTILVEGPPPTDPGPALARTVLTR